MPTAVAQPVRLEKLFVGKVQHRGKVFTVPVKEALSRNEARDVLGQKYSLVLDVWIEQTPSRV